MDVSIRPITLDDTKNIVKWRNSDFVLINFIDQTLISEESHINYFNKYVKTGIVHQFIIKVDGNDIGSTFLRDVNLEDRSAEFGIFIGNANYLGKGVGKLALSLLMEYAFKTLKLKKVILRVLKRNERAIKSYRKSGFHLIDRSETVLVNGNKETVIFMEMGCDD